MLAGVAAFVLAADIITKALVVAHLREGTLGLLLGGALGNLTDRIFRSPGLFRGNVVDWIEVTRYWPVFNLADSAIVCGGILIVLLSFSGRDPDGTVHKD